MQLGKTLVGAIIGAALGIGLLLVAYLQFGIDKMWLAIPVALLTGFGVRMMVATSGRASYLRGAITVVLALGAYLGGLTISKTIANHRAANADKPSPHVAAKDEPGEPVAAKEGEPAAEAPPVIAPPTTAAPSDVAVRRPMVPGQFSTWDFLSLAVAALVAYELGRGTAAVPVRVVETDRPSGPPPAGTHPDA